VYFDSTKTRKEGRKIPKRLAKPSPTLKTLQDALVKLGFSYELIPDVSHPHFPRKKTGYILISKEGKKKQTLRKIAAALA
jgi:signal recognition particle subunit SRP19